MVAVDIVEAGVAARYHVYIEKRRKPKIRYCIGFSPDAASDWIDVRTDEDAEAFVRRCVRDAVASGAHYRHPYTSARPLPFCPDASRASSHCRRSRPVRSR